MEREVIQSVGFRNIKKEGNVTGFQFKIRLPYYRGIFLSQIRPGTLFVDGERFEKEDIIWNIHGEIIYKNEINFQTHLGCPAYSIIKLVKEEETFQVP